MKTPLLALLLAALLGDSSILAADPQSPDVNSSRQRYSIDASQDTGRYVRIIESESHKLMGKIDVGKPHSGDDSCAMWSKDGLTLVWSGMGKWGPDTLVFAKIDRRGKLTVKNLLKSVKAGVLARLKANSPSYGKVSKTITQGTDHIDDGFTFDMRATPSEVPSQVSLTVGVTSDPNMAQPSYAQLEADLSGEISEQGQFRPRTVNIYSPTEIARIKKENDHAFESEDAVGKKLLPLLSETKRKQLEEQQSEWTDALNARKDREGFSFTGIGWVKTESMLWRARAEELRRMLKDAEQKP